MKTLTLRSHFNIPGGCNTKFTNSTPTSPFLTIIPFKTKYPTKKTSLQLNKPIIPEKHLSNSSNGYLRLVMVGAASIGVILFFMGMDDHKALALGPEGPLMEEFWDNVRRYALYALTVSTGALYTILQPIVELLKNPISAVLVVLIFGGGFYIVSQVLSAMFGVTDFSYDYSY